MKRFLRRYLLQQPTFFSWLCVLGCLAAVVYLVFGIIAITQSAEGVMVVLFVPYFIIITLFILAGDFILRTLLKKRLIWISALELLLFTAIAFNYYHTKLYKIQLVVNHPSNLVVLVRDDEHGLEIKHSLFQLHFSAEVPSNNIVLLDSSSFELLWYNLRIKSNSGIVYTNFYPMQYSDRTTVRCGNKDYSIQFIQLEIKGKRLPTMDDRMFDSVHQVVCALLNTR
ncbi:MAG: hypothetical protein ACXVLT_01855 [Flavisolibacter sp.]